MRQGYGLSGAAFILKVDMRDLDKALWSYFGVSDADIRAEQRASRPEPMW